MAALFFLVAQLPFITAQQEKQSQYLFHDSHFHLTN